MAGEAVPGAAAAAVAMGDSEGTDQTADSLGPPAPTESDAGSAKSGWSTLLECTWGDLVPVGASEESKEQAMALLKAMSTEGHLLYVRSRLRQLHAPDLVSRIRRNLDYASDSWRALAAFYFVNTELWIILKDRALQHRLFATPAEVSDHDAASELALRLLIPALAFDDGEAPRVDPLVFARIVTKLGVDLSAAENGGFNTFIALAQDVIWPGLEQVFGDPAVPRRFASPLPETRPVKGAVPLRIFVFGETAVGKTSVIQRYLLGDAAEIQLMLSTIEMGVHQVPNVRLDRRLTGSDVTANVTLLDPAGQERFRSAISPALLRNLDGIVHVTTADESKHTRQRWLSFLRDRMVPDDVPLVVFENKSDLWPEVYSKLSGRLPSAPGHPPTFWGSAKARKRDGGIPDLFSYIFTLAAAKRLAADPDAATVRPTPEDAIALQRAPQARRVTRPTCCGGRR